jgi:hypothetical protein
MSAYFILPNLIIMIVLDMDTDYEARLHAMFSIYESRPSASVQKYSSQYSVHNILNVYTYLKWKAQQINLVLFILYCALLLPCLVVW